MIVEQRVRLKISRSVKIPKDMLRFGLSPLPGCQSPPGLWTIFRIGDPNLNLHLPQESWEGGQPKLRSSCQGTGLSGFKHKKGVGVSNYPKSRYLFSSCLPRHSPCFQGPGQGFRPTILSATVSHTNSKRSYHHWWSSWKEKIYLKRRGQIEIKQDFKPLQKVYNLL